LWNGLLLRRRRASDWTETTSEDEFLEVEYSRGCQYGYRRHGEIDCAAANGCVNASTCLRRCLSRSSSALRMARLLSRTGMCYNRTQYLVMVHMRLRKRYLQFDKLLLPQNSTHDRLTFHGSLLCWIQLVSRVLIKCDEAVAKRSCPTKRRIITCRVATNSASLLRI
uniref:ShKT domain-containing protein n=1 Tax=Macrostomum lignano TaxID=282301 RepID=A0A1I8FMP6_9PLAT